MKSESQNKPTLFEDEIDDIFLRSFSKENRPKTSNKHLEAYFLV